MSKKISLKKLKELRDRLNYLSRPEGEPKYYITVYGKDMDTGTDIFVINDETEYAQRADANWSYHLVLGIPRDAKK
jgi:predicted DNA-binding protein